MKFVIKEEMAPSESASAICGQSDRTYGTHSGLDGSFSFSFLIPILQPRSSVRIVHAWRWLYLGTPPRIYLFELFRYAYICSVMRSWVTTPDVDYLWSVSRSLSVLCIGIHLNIIYIRCRDRPFIIHLIFVFSLCSGFGRASECAAAVHVRRCQKWFLYLFPFSPLLSLSLSRFWFFLSRFSEGNAHSDW